MPRIKDLRLIFKNFPGGGPPDPPVWGPPSGVPYPHPSAGPSQMTFRRPCPGIDCAICACASQNRCGVAVGLSVSESICTMSCICTSCTVAVRESRKLPPGRYGGRKVLGQAAWPGSSKHHKYQRRHCHRTVPCTRTARTTNIASSTQQACQCDRACICA